MEKSRLDRVQIDVAGRIVEISWGERDALIGKLRLITGFETIIDKFKAVGASRPVELDAGERADLRTVLELWGVRVMPAGLARLLMALVRAAFIDEWK
jgi:hypothetical protein